VTDTLTPPEGEASDELDMGMDPWEKNWIRFSVLLLVGFAAAITVAGFAAGFQLPGDEGQVDPQALTESPPWDAPGVYEIGDGQFEAYIVGQTWSFAPPEIVVPVGAEVDMYVTSPDLQHGFKVLDTNINVMVVPGQVSKLKFEFDEVGEFPYICTEYCGQGHAAMFGRVRVVSQEEYDAQAAGGDAPADDTTDGEEEGGDE
jgi:cytochrome c oxidase subunit 2